MRLDTKAAREESSENKWGEMHLKRGMRVGEKNRTGDADWTEVMRDTAARFVKGLCIIYKGRISFFAFYYFFLWLAEFFLPEKDEVIILDWEKKEGEVYRGSYGREEPQSQLFHGVSAPQNSVINLQQVFHTHKRTHTCKHRTLHLHRYCGNRLASQTPGTEEKKMYIQMGRDGMVASGPHMSGIHELLLLF